MKNDLYTRTLIGIALAILFCSECVAQIVTVTVAANSTSASGIVANTQVNEDERSVSPNFAYSESISADDGSTAFASLTTDFNGTTLFQAFGRVVLTPGQSSGNPSQLADAQGTTYLTIKMDVPVHYQFTASCQSVGSAQAGVLFNGQTFVNDTVFSDGAFAAGTTITLEGYGNTTTGTMGGQSHWSYGLQLTPTNIPERFSQDQKANFLTQSRTLQSAGKQTVAEVGAAPSAQTAEILQQIADIQLANSTELYYQYLDPLDTNYTVLAQVVIPPVVPLVASNGVTQLEADACNAWLTNLSQTAGYGAAFNTAVNRAQGANYAGDTFWDNAQMSAAVQFEANLAVLFDREPALRSNALVQFQAGGFPSITVTSNEVMSFQMQINSSGLPASLQNGLAGVGLDSGSISNIQADLVASDPAAMAGSFPQSLMNTNLDAAQHATAASLRDASLVLVNAAVLPSGKFRFDLPTEPGYTYQIQFTENPANPAGWTALLTNNATTTLLSFTNGLNVGANGGFYRATHN